MFNECWEEVILEIFQRAEFWGFGQRKFVSVCVCVCVYVRDRETGRGERETGRESLKSRTQRISLASQTNNLK